MNSQKLQEAINLLKDYNQYTKLRKYDAELAFYEKFLRECRYFHYSEDNCEKLDARKSFSQTQLDEFLEDYNNDVCKEVIKNNLELINDYLNDCINKDAKVDNILKDLKNLNNKQNTITVIWDEKSK